MPSLVTGIIGGIQGASAAHNAANAQVHGYQQAADSVNTAVSNANPIIQNAATTAGTNLTNTANTAVANLSPYSTLGANAAGTLQQLTNPGANITALMNTLDPGYEFRLQQGEQGVQQSAAASGLLQSGAAARGLNNYASNYASNEYNNTFNRLSTLANMGTQVGEYSGNLTTNAAGQAGQWGVNAGNLQASNLVNAGVYTGNTQIGSGNAIAQGDIGAANSWNGMLNGIGSAANAVAFGGLGGSPGTSPGWSLGNLGKNLWG